MSIFIERCLAQPENEKQDKLIQETLGIYYYFPEVATVGVLKKGVPKNFIKSIGKNLFENFFFFHKVADLRPNNIKVRKCTQQFRIFTKQNLAFNFIRIKYWAK